MCLSLKSLFLIAFVYLQVRFYFVRAEKNLGLIPSYKISVLGSYLKKESQCFFWFFFRGFFDIFLTTVVFLLFELVIRYSGIQVHPGSTFQDSDLSYSAVQEGLRKPWSGFLLLAVLLGKKNMDLTCLRGPCEKSWFTNSCRENQIQNFLVSTVVSSGVKWEK